MRNFIIRILLSPLTLLYGVGIGIRDVLYKTGLLKSVKFDIPIISIGNLTVGGSGKTPHIEYLIRLLKDYLNVATLSRGYKRKTQGFRMVEIDDTAETVGDEPLQFKRKFPEILVAVGENRSMAIPQILMRDIELHTILLDDAYQHRQIQPGLNILLTEYSRPFYDDYLLPSGRLREWRAAYKRANIIIVTKCPNQLSDEERLNLHQKIQPYPHQRLYFSRYKYGIPYQLFAPQVHSTFNPDWNVMVICAIANVNYLVEYLKQQVAYVRLMEFPDHHNFSKSEIGQLNKKFKNWEAKNKVIITTEKDAMRLELHAPYLREQQLPILVLPISVDFHHTNDSTHFDDDVKQFLLNFRV